MARIISVTDFVRHASRVAEEVGTAGAVYRITRGGRGSMVLVNEEYFDGWMAAIDEMRRPDWQQAWAKTTSDIAARRGRSLDTIAKELGLEGTAHPAGRKPARRAAASRGATSRRGAARSPRRTR